MHRPLHLRSFVHENEWLVAVRGGNDEELRVLAGDDEETTNHIQVIIRRAIYKS
ncbi:hypothetical protein BVRB_1g012480 [Beta vulgaris subsp. vulgaris]|nr:hypothetical protein BVRB_1g012480 [Beta vulgaris subsp. vulgaris]